MADGTLRLAVAQTPAELEPQARLDWLAKALPQIAMRADLLLLPELFVCGYNIGDLITQRAETIDGPSFQAISALAKNHGIAVHYGFSERSGSKIFNAAACVSGAGELLCHQRKLAIPPGFERDVFSEGEGCQFFEFAGLKIATLICYDAEFSETVRHVAGLGAELVLVPTALGAQWDWVARTMIPCRAYENGVYVAYANSAGNENGMDFLGASVIAAPDGVECARAGAEPQVIYAELGSARVQAAQARLPYLKDRRKIKL